GGAELGPEAGVGQDVLQRLEGSDGPAERGAGLGVVDRDLHQPAHRADRFGEVQGGGDVELTFHVGLCATGRADHRVGADLDAVEAHVDEPAGEVEPAERDDVDPGR